jgi:hypothetical protein
VIALALACRIAVAAVWLVFGLVFKAADVVPRHRAIVARVLGERWSRPVILAVAFGEATLGAWMLWGRALPICAAVQSVAIVTMNTLELRYARDLLLSPRLMLLANAALLSAAWYAALAR